MREHDSDAWSEVQSGSLQGCGCSVTFQGQVIVSGLGLQGSGMSGRQGALSKMHEKRESVHESGDESG